MLDRDLAAPRHPRRSIGPRPRDPELAVEERLEREVAVPRQPPFRPHDELHVGVDEHRPRVLLPRPPEVGPVDGGFLAVERDVVVAAVDDAAAEDEAGGLGGVGAAVGGEGVGLAVLRVELTGEEEYEAIVEDGGGVAEDEVDGAGDAAVPVELPEGVGVEGVLVAQEFHGVDDGQVAVGAEGHRLVGVRPGRVGEGQVPGSESVAADPCAKRQKLPYTSKNSHQTNRRSPTIIGPL